MTKTYYVYILTNNLNTVFYTGVTNNLHRRVAEHRGGFGGQFTKRYRLNKLVYYESGSDIKAALFREKQIKAGSRSDKVNLVNSLNPDWKDLYDGL